MFGVRETAVAAAYRDAAARLIPLVREPAWADASHAAWDAGQKILTASGPAGSPRGDSRLAEISSLHLREEEDSLSVALRWAATAPTGSVFPVLDADLTLLPAAAPPAVESSLKSRLRLIYSYRPLPGRSGNAMDTAILGRVADATTRSFLEDLAHLLTDSKPQRL